MDRSEDALIALIGDIYLAAVDPTAWQGVCRRLADRFQATGFVVQINDTANGTLPLYVNSGIDPAAALDYAAAFAASDPRVLHSLLQPVGRAHHDHEFIDEGGMRRHPYYAFLGAWGFRYYAAGIILRQGTLVANASFQRSPAQGPATPQDLALLERLLPHLGRAMELGLRLKSLERRQSALEQFLEQASFGAALLAAGGQVLFLNQEARRITASGDGLAAGSAGLRALRPGDDARLQRLIGSAAAVAHGNATDGGGSLGIPKKAGRHPYALVVSPLARESGLFLSAHPAVLVLITDPDAPHRPSPDLLRQTFGLTGAELEVCAALLAGQSVAQVAANRRISPRTVRSHLETIFRKTGTTRQADLLRLLLRVPAQGQAPQ